MKKLLLTAVLILIINQVKSQTDLPKDENGSINFTEVVTTTNELTESQIFDNFKDWISTKSVNFNRSNSEKNQLLFGTAKANFVQIDALHKNDAPLKLSDKESFKLIARIVNKYTGTQMGCIRIVYFQYDLIVKIKDGRYKYEITNFTYIHYNQVDGKQVQFYAINDKGPCKSKGDLNELLQCDKCKGEFAKMYAYLIADTNNFIANMKASIDIKKTDDNW